MRTLFFIATILAALYGGYWVLGSSRIEAGAETALAQLEAQGWDVAYADLDTQGFPSRFDTTVTDLSLASPDGRLSWEAPFVQLLALSYRPNQVIAAFPPDQRVGLPGQTLDIAAQDLRASATVGLSADLPLDRATLESGLAALSSDAGWGFGLDRLLAAIRRAGDGTPNGYDLYLEANGLRPQSVSANLGLLKVDGQVTLDRPLDRHARSPRLQAVSLREARLAHGDAALTATGDLAPDAQGYLAGTLTLRAENWRSLLALLESAGLLVFDQGAVLAGALEQLAQGQDDLEVPLTFRNGQVEALGVVLLQAPRVL